MKYQAVVVTDVGSSAFSRVESFLREVGKETSSPALMISVGTQISVREYEVKIDYEVLDNAKIISLAGLGYDLNSGYITLTPIPHCEPLGVFNLDEWLDRKVGGLDKSQFHYNIERYKLGEIENPKDIFDLTPSGNPSASSSMCKRYLAEALSGDKTDRDAYTLYTEFVNLMREFYAKMYSFARIIENPINLVSDTGCLFSCAEGSILNRYSNLKFDASRDTSKIFEPTAGMYEYHRKNLNAKSVLKFLNVRELLSVAGDEDEKIMAQLTSSDDDIKTVVKNSSVKDIVKGAMLSGVIKKKDDIIYNMNRPITAGYFGNLQDFIVRYSSYIKTIFNKIKL